ncbi:MAG: AMP-binding protein, partial [Treponemataceae bacterium]
MLQLERLTLTRLVETAAARFGEHKAFSVVGENGETGEISYAKFGSRARGFAAVLSQLGIVPGDRVMLLAENRPEWPIAYFGIALAGTVSVPILTDFLPEHVATVALHAELRAVCATAKTLQKLKDSHCPLFDEIPIIRLDAMDDNGCLVSIAGRETVVPYTEIGARHDAEENDLASIIYTSGTTGKSKGVMLSHKNLVFDAAACRSIIKIYPRDRFLSVLPL